MRTIKNRNKNGRPKLVATQKKKERIEIRFATMEYYTLKSKARKAGITISEFIRAAIERCEVKERLSATHLRLITQLIGMANNLNQIARKANAAGYSSVRAEYLRAAEIIDNIRKQAKQ